LPWLALSASSPLPCTGCSSSQPTNHRRRGLHESSQSFIKALQVWCISLLPAFPPPPAQISPKVAHKHRKKGMIFIPASSRREQQPGSWRVSTRRGGAGNRACRSLGGAGNRATRTCEAGPGAGNPSAWHKMEDLTGRRRSSLMPREKPGIAVALFWASSDPVGRLHFVEIIEYS
jgi:hypothetical protein